MEGPGGISDLRQLPVAPGHCPVEQLRSSAEVEVGGDGLGKVGGFEVIR